MSNFIDSASAISATMREYLGEVYRLQSPTDGPATTSALAERLDVSPPAAVKMIRRLAREGYLEHEPYKGVRLTSAGEREALHSIRTHRLLEAFLVTVMGFGWEEVHAYAHKLEPAIDERFEDRMDELAGYPKRCPHGDPIPTKDGHMPVVNDVSIMDCPVGTQGIIRRVRNHTPEKLIYLEELSLLPGAEITLVGRAPFNGPVRLRTAAGEEHVLGAELARDLLIEKTTINSV